MSSYACGHCHDTGSLAKDLDSMLDCTRCDVATERTLLESWAKDLERQHHPMTILWLAHRRAQQAAQAAK